MYSNLGMNKESCKKMMYLMYFTYTQILQSIPSLSFLVPCVMQVVFPGAFVASTSRVIRYKRHGTAIVEALQNTPVAYWPKYCPSCLEAFHLN